jgi:pimeloyl-ACP methyl ester carboxylesterase
MTTIDAPVVVRCLRETPAAEPLQVLLLHGLASSSTMWDQFVARADRDCKLWVADLPWRGEGVAGWAEQQDVARWIIEALAAVPGGADVVVAHSFAANVLLAYLDSGGAQPQAIVLVSPFYRPAAEDFDWYAIAYYLNDFDRILAEGIRVRSGGRLEPELQRDMAMRVRDRVGPYGWVRFFETYLRTPRLRMDRITVPCLVIGGEDDFASFPSDSRAVAAALPNAQGHILSGCGHFAMSERADEFTALINEFLSTVQRTLE